MRTALCVVAGTALLVACGDKSAKDEPAAFELPTGSDCGIGAEPIAGEIELGPEHDGGIVFSPCGHVATNAALFNPQLEQVVTFDGVASPVAFAPTGEGLLLELDGGELAYLDVATHERQALGIEARDRGIWVRRGFAMRRDRGGSLVWTCTDGHISVLGGSGWNELVAGVVCDDRLALATQAPVLAFGSAAGEIGVVDLETGAVTATGLASVHGEMPYEPYDGATHADLVHLSPDGSLLLLQRGLQVLDWDVELPVVDPEVLLLDLHSGATSALPASQQVGFVEVLDAPGAKRAFAWAGAPTVYVGEDGVPLQLGDNTPLSAAGTRTLGYAWKGIFEPFDWYWLDFQSGTVDAVTEPLLRYFTPPDNLGGYYPPHASPNGRAFAIAAEASPSDTTLVWTEQRGWQTVPWRVEWIGDDGSLLTSHPAAWRDATGAVLFDFGEGKVGYLEQRGDHAVANIARKTWVLDLANHTARELDARHGFYVPPEGHRVFWEGPNGRYVITTL